MAESAHIREHDLCAAWVGMPASRLVTTDGRSVDIVHRGTWSHGFGPDFRDALLTIGDGPLLTGSVELHLRTSGWHAHGHHLDPRYNDVLLHVVLEHDGAETRRQDGAIVPVLVFPFPVEPSRVRHAVEDWSLVGGAICAEAQVRTNPLHARRILQHLGDARLSIRTARLEAALTASTPHQVLLEELFEALGYAENRVPMRQLALLMCAGCADGLIQRTLPEQRLATTRALLFGVAGFLPLSPSDAQRAGLTPSDVALIETTWASVSNAWRHLCLPPAAWQTARIRPANHPVVRLAQAAALLARTGGDPAADLRDALRDTASCDELVRELFTAPGSPPLGIDRARTILINVAIPYFLAISHVASDAALEELAMTAWDALPAADSNHRTRRALHQVAGGARLTGLGARGQQGLIHLDTAFCGPRRCFECPVGQWVVRQPVEATSLVG